MRPVSSAACGVSVLFIGRRLLFLTRVHTTFKRNFQWELQKQINSPMEDAYYEYISCHDHESLSPMYLHYTNLFTYVTHSIVRVYDLSDTCVYVSFYHFL